MANIKISELDELQKATDQDLLAIVDVANNKTKKIQAGNLGILVPKTTTTTSDTETYSCNYVNEQVDDLNTKVNNKPNANNAYTASATDTYTCNYINANTIPVINFSGDFNNYKETAIGQCQMSANKPPTDANYFYGTVIVIKFGSAYCSQLTTDINTGKIYNRVLINGSWGAWKEIQQNNV